MKIKYLLLLLIFFSSCNFLDEYTQNELRPTSVEDYDNVLIGDGYYYSVTSGKDFMPYYDLLSDDVESYVPSLDKNNNVSEADHKSITNCTPFYTWDKEMFEVGEKNESVINTWETLYRKILTCNVVIVAIDNDDCKGSYEDMMYLKGQALCLRSFYYYILTNLFADPYNSGDPTKILAVPFVDTYIVNNEFPKKVTIEKMYENLIADLEEGKSLLEKYSPYAPIVLRTSPAMANVLLSRIYMQMAVNDEDDNWDKVIFHCNEVLKTKSRLTNLNTVVTNSMFLGMGIANFRALPYMYNSSTDFSADEFIFGYIQEGSSRKHFFTDNSENLQVRAFGPSEKLLGLYEKTIKHTYSGLTGVSGFKGDIRYIAYFVPRFANDPNPSNPSKVGKTFHPYYGGRLMPMVPSFPSASMTNDGTNHGMGVAEVYLNLAEALIRTGKSATAFNHLNNLRKHRITTAEYEDKFPGTKDEDLKFCLEERRRELSFDHTRWFDLRRLGREPLVKYLRTTGGVNEYSLKKNDPRFTLPIPRYILDRNPELI